MKPKTLDWLDDLKDGMRIIFTPLDCFMGKHNYKAMCRPEVYVEFDHCLHCGKNKYSKHEKTCPRFRMMGIHCGKHATDLKW